MADINANEAHARAIVKLNEVLDKINAALDKLLGQKGI